MLHSFKRPLCFHYCSLLFLPPSPLHLSHHLSHPFSFSPPLFDPSFLFLPNFFFSPYYFHPNTKYSRWFSFSLFSSFFCSCFSFCSLEWCGVFFYWSDASFVDLFTGSLSLSLSFLSFPSSPSFPSLLPPFHNILYFFLTSFFPSPPLFIKI